MGFSKKKHLETNVSRCRFLVGAGGCREPRKIKRNPGRGSQRLRRALGGTRILLAAAPTAPPCFCRWQRSSLLHWAVFAPSSATSPQLFESTLEGETLGLDKTKTSAYLCTLRFFGGRGWISRAAQNKKEPGSRLPAAASCLGRHAHPAGRSPNSSSLLLPLAAVVAVAQGLFCPPDYSAGLTSCACRFFCSPLAGL